MESCAEFRTISSQANSSRPVGLLSRILEEGGQGLGAPLQLPLGQRPPALDVDPVGGDAHQHVGSGARAELSLHQRRHLTVGALGQVGTGDKVTSNSKSSCRSLASATTRPSQGCGMRWSEPFMHSRSPMRKPATSSTLSLVRRISALASSGRAAPLP